MRKATLSKLFFALMLILMLALVACSDNTDGDGNASGSDDDKSEEENGDDGEDDGLYSIDDFDNIKNNEGEEIDGGSFTFGLVSDTAFEGTHNWNFYSGNSNSKILSWYNKDLLTGR